MSSPVTRPFRGVSAPERRQIRRRQLVEAAFEVHGHATLLQAAGQFPNPTMHTLPLDPEAARYYKSGKSFAYRYLPFWVATLLDRAVVVLLRRYVWLDTKTQA